MSNTFLRSNNTVLGGTIDNTPIGTTTPSVGFFTNLSVDGVSNLDQTNVDTTDGSFSVTGTNPIVFSTSGPSSWTTTSGTLSLSSNVSNIVLSANEVQSTAPVSILSTSGSSSTTTGALVVSGGVGIAENLYIGGNTNIGGNLTVSGTTTTVESETVVIADNIIVVNNGPSSTKDGGLLVNRYQTDNNIGSGDVVAGVAEETGTSGTIGSNTIVLTNAVSTTVDYYVGWWVRMTSGAASGQVRRISAYSGASRIATLSSAWTPTIPSPGQSYGLYACNYVGLIWDEDSDELRAICTDESSTDNVDIIKYLDLRANDVYVEGDLSISGSIIGTPTFTSLEVLNLDTPAPGPSGPLYIGQTNANAINIGHSGMNTNIFSDALVLSTGTDLRPQTTGTSDIGTSLLRFANIYFSGISYGGSYSTENVYPNTNNTYDLGTNSNAYRDIYFDGVARGTTWDTQAVSETMNIGTTNAGTINIGRSGFTTQVQGNLSVAGTFSMLGTFAFSTELISVPAASAASPTTNKVVSYIDVTGVPGFPATGVMPAGLSDGFIKCIVCIGHVDDYVLTFGATLVDAVGVSTGTMKLRFLSTGQSAYLIWRSATSKWYIIGGSGCQVQTV